MRPLFATENHPRGFTLNAPGVCDQFYKKIKKIPNFIDIDLLGLGCRDRPGLWAVGGGPVRDISLENKRIFNIYKNYT